MRKAAVRFLSILLISALLCGTAAAADSPAPQSSIGLDEMAELLSFTGFMIGNGESLLLDKELTRAEAAVLAVRVAGYTYDAAFHTGENPFTDVPEWAEINVSFLYNKGFVMGISDTLFGSELPVTANEFYAMLLRVLGYSESDGDFTYSDSLTFAKKIGLLDTDEETLLLSQPFDRGHAVYAVYHVLNCEVKNTDQKLCYKVSKEINASYDRTIASIIAGDNKTYTVLKKAVLAMQALKSYTITQTGDYRETHEDGSADSAELLSNSYIDRTNLKALIEIEITSIEGGETVNGAAGIYYDNGLFLQKNYSEDWASNDQKYAYGAYYLNLYEVLFGPTLDYCADLDTVYDGDEITVSGFCHNANLMFDITSSGNADYYYDLEITFNAETGLPKRASVSYQDIWRDGNGSDDSPLSVDYRVEYTFTDFDTTTAASDDAALNEAIKTTKAS